MQSDQINELVAAFAKAQGQMKNAAFNRVNPHFKNSYADLAAIWDAIRKPLSDHGLIASQTTEIREGGLVLVTILAHSSGQWIRSEYPLPVAGRPQEMGSAMTYGKRYSLSAIVGIAADEDDDANAAEDGKQKIEARGRAPKPGNVNIAAPQASKYTKPVALVAPSDPENRDGWIAFGQELVAGVKAVGQQGEWFVLNKQQLERMQDEAPKVYERVMANMTPQKEAAE